MLYPEQQVGPYKILAQIGQGGMATVYKAYHERLERYVAIKVMHQALLQDPNFHTRFAREAKIIAKLEHPNIIPVYDYAEVEGVPYLVIKHIEGRTLKQTLIKKPLDLNEILRVLTPIADALDYAHRLGVLHRDIKPSNIILDPNGVPYLTDFGMARIAQVGESTISADMMLGTPQYISPEQALGKQDLDAHTDLYSLGVVLYELIVGQVPFSGDTPYSVIHDHIYRPLPAPREINPDVTPEVEAVLIKALAKNPGDRYSSGGEMMTALREAVRVSGMHELNPERREQAAESLARQRNAEPLVPPVAVPVPQPKIEAPHPKRVTEIKIDLGSEDINQELRKAGDELRKAGQEIGTALRDVGREFQREFSSDSKAQFKPNTWSSNNSGSSDDDDKDMPVDEESYLRRRIAKRIEERNGFIGHAAAFFAVNLGLWGIYFMSGAGDFPWPAMVSAFWGAGLLAHTAEAFFNTGSRAAKRDRAVREAMRSTYGPHWFSIASKKQYKEVRNQVTKGARKVQDFFEHLGAYVGVNAGLWIIFLLNGGFSDGFPWPIFVSFFWGLGLVTDAFETLGAFQKQNEVERQLAREMNDDSLLEKPKRGAMRLTDDGELTDSMIESFESEEKPKRQTR